MRKGQVSCFATVWSRTGAFLVLGGLCLFASACQRGVGRKAAIEAAKKRASAAKEAPATKAPAKADNAAGTIAQTIQVADCSSLISRICSDLGEQHMGCTLSREKIPAVGDAECKQLGPRYGALIADLQLRAKAQEDASPQVMKRLMSMGTPPAFGDAQAPVQIVEFLDFECSGCARLQPTVETIRAKTQKGGAWEGKVRYVARMKPLASMHEHATLAAQAALAAHAQGAFWAYHDLLFSNQTDLSKANLLVMAGLAKLDTEAFEKALEGDAVKKQLAQDVDLAKEVTAVATPSLFVNGKRIHPGLLEMAIGEQLAASKTTR